MFDLCQKNCSFFKQSYRLGYVFCLVHYAWFRIGSEDVFLKQDNRVSYQRYISKTNTDTRDRMF